MNPIYRISSVMVRVGTNRPILQISRSDRYVHVPGERVLGKAIKELKLPRANLVIMTKVSVSCLVIAFNPHFFRRYLLQAFQPIPRSFEEGDVEHGRDALDKGYVNQSGLSRKVQFIWNPHIDP